MTTQSMHVVLGSGASGRAVVNALLDADKPVRVVNRSGRGDFPAGVELVGGDAFDPAFVQQVTADAAVVYNCLALPYDQWADRFLPLWESVLNGVAASGAKLVVLDNLYMVGDTGGAPMTEDTPSRPNSRKGHIRAQAADLLLDAHRSGHARVTIGRASDFFGPYATDQSHVGSRVIVPALAGKTAQVIGNPDLPHTLTYLPDIGRALVMLGEREEALGRVWHLPSPPTGTLREAIALVYAEAGHEPKLSSAPKLILRMMGLFNPIMREVVEMLYQFEEPFVMDSSQFTAVFGMTATPLPAAIRETVAWFRANQAA
jgi:nucleoside-diphosphate-sugar epimerase